MTNETLSLLATLALFCGCAQDRPPSPSAPASASAIVREPAPTETLATCTSCHSTFKQEVVDDATWASRTKQAAPSGPMHM
jgi:hypothetical protein